jgi:hypothetical protein
LSNKLIDSLGSAQVAIRPYLSGHAQGFPITASLVADAQGSTTNSTGNSKGLGNAVDLQLLLALRRKSDVVATSGRTFLAEEYKMPSESDLAVFSRSPVDVTHLATGQKQKLHVFEGASGGSKISSSVAILQGLGYEKIHCEFGEFGTAELIQNHCLDALFLSSRSSRGADLLAAKLAVEPTLRFELGGLSVAIVAWHSGVRALAG